MESLALDSAWGKLESLYKVTDSASEAEYINFSWSCSFLLWTILYFLRNILIVLYINSSAKQMVLNIK